MAILKLYKKHKIIAFKIVCKTFMYNTKKNCNLQPYESYKNKTEMYYVH